MEYTYSYYADMRAGGLMLRVSLLKDGKPTGMRRTVVRGFGKWIVPNDKVLATSSGTAPTMLHEGYLKAIDELTAEVLTLEEFAESKLDKLHASYEALL